MLQNTLTIIDDIGDAPLPRPEIIREMFAKIETFCNVKTEWFTDENGVQHSFTTIKPKM